MAQDTITMSPAEFNAPAAAPAPAASTTAAPASAAITMSPSEFNSGSTSDPFAAFGGKLHTQTWDEQVQKGRESRPGYLPPNSMGPQLSTSEQLKRDPGMPLRNKIREIENYTQEGRKVHPILATVGDYLRNVYVPGAEAPNDLDHPLAQPVPPPLPGLSGALEGAAAESTAATAAAQATRGAEAVAQPGAIKQIVQGKAVAQPQAQAALKTAATSAANSAGVSTVPPEGVRSLLEDPISSIEAQAKANYKAMDEVTGGKFQPVVDSLKNVNEKLRSSIEGTPEYAEAQATKTRLEWQQEKLFDEAAKNGVPKTVVENARAQFRQAQAMRELESKVFKNPTNVPGDVAHGTDETVNVDSVVKALRKLADNKEWGSSRLEQALGSPEAADKLLDDMYAAQRLGVKAMDRRTLAERIGITVGSGVGLYEALKGSFSKGKP
jgi:hypothetical protein